MISIEEINLIIDDGIQKDFLEHRACWKGVIDGGTNQLSTDSVHDAYSLKHGFCALVESETYFEPRIFDGPIEMTVKRLQGHDIVDLCFRYEDESDCGVEHSIEFDGFLVDRVSFFPLDMSDKPLG